MITLSDLKGIKANIYLAQLTIDHRIEEITADMDKVEEDPFELDFYCREYYLVSKGLEDIQKMIKAYINTRTALETYVANEEWDEAKGTDCEATGDIYDYVAHWFADDYVLIKIRKWTSRFFENYHEMNERLTGGFKKFFPDAKYHKAVSNDLTGEREMVEMTEKEVFEMEMEEKLESIENQEPLKEFRSRMKKIQSMIAEKADPLEILKLLK